MKIILESDNSKEFVVYEGKAIDALLKITKYSILPPYQVDFGRQHIVRYIDRDAGKVVNLHMSKYANTEDYQVIMLSQALHNGVQNDETYQVEKITSTSIPVDENGLPGILGKGFSV